MYAPFSLTCKMSDVSLLYELSRVQILNDIIFMPLCITYMKKVYVHKTVS